MNMLRSSTQLNNYMRGNTPNKDKARMDLDRNLNFSFKNGKPQRPMTSFQLPKKSETVMTSPGPTQPNISLSPNLNKAVDDEMKKLCSRTRLSIKA